MEGLFAESIELFIEYQAFSISFYFLSLFLGVPVCLWLSLLSDGIESREGVWEEQNHTTGPL